MSVRSASTATKQMGTGSPRPTRTQRTGFTATVDSSQAMWAVLGADGATDLVAAADPSRWPEVAEYDQEQLDDLLNRLHLWERNTVDARPEGTKLITGLRPDPAPLRRSGKVGR